MAHIYYSHPMNRQGKLRAVLPAKEAINLLKKHLGYYAGQEFPMTHQPVEADFAVLQLLEEDENEEWRHGFYQFDDNILRVEETLSSRKNSQAPLSAK
jgi:hypothetical protein